MTDREKLEANKHLVDRLFKEVLHEAVNPDLSKLDEIVHEDYIQHNPLVGQGRAGLREFFMNVAPSLDAGWIFDSPLITVNLAADGDLVFRQEIRRDWMLIDVFRVEGGWLVEHWEAWHFMPGVHRPSFLKS